MDYLDEALSLYKLTKDPLTLDSIRVLADPKDPHYEDVKAMIERMVDARKTLFPPE